MAFTSQDRQLTKISPIIQGWFLYPVNIYKYDIWNGYSSQLYRFQFIHQHTHIWMCQWDKRKDIVTSQKLNLSSCHIIIMLVNFVTYIFVKFYLTILSDQRPLTLCCYYYKTHYLATINSIITMSMTTIAYKQLLPSPCHGMGYQ